MWWTFTLLWVGQYTNLDFVYLRITFNYFLLLFGVSTDKVRRDRERQRNFLMRISSILSRFLHKKCSSFLFFYSKVKKKRKNYDKYWRYLNIITIYTSTVYKIFVSWLMRRVLHWTSTCIHCTIYVKSSEEHRSNRRRWWWEIIHD